MRKDFRLLTMFTGKHLQRHLLHDVLRVLHRNSDVPRAKEHGSRRHLTVDRPHPLARTLVSPPARPPARPAIRSPILTIEPHLDDSDTPGDKLKTTKDKQTKFYTKK